MAYFVAKTLKMRPMDILMGWTCEELLVAYGVYANQKSSEAYELTSKKERRLKKMTELDRWVMPFITSKQLDEINNPPAKEKDVDDMDNIAEIIFGS